jgi:succinoglycan biosynthesis protein ExoA
VTSATVSVIIPCRNEAEFIEDLLTAVLAQELQPLETIVVDNGSTDASIAVIEAFATRHPEMTLRVISCRRPGAAAAMNAGIKAATGEFIVRIDGHSIPRPDYLRLALDRLREPRAGVVGGAWEIVPGADTLRARAIALAVGSRLGSGGAAYRHGDDRTTAADVDTVPFGCYSRALWQELDGYDDDLLVVEDGDFNFRVRQAGYRIVLDPAIRCQYFPRRRMRTLALQYFRYGWWKIPLLTKHPHAIRIRQIMPLGFVSTVLLLALGSAFLTFAKALLFLLVAVYSVAVVAGALPAVRRGGDLRLWPFIVVAFVVIHFAWGLGGLTHLLTLGHWPPWRLAPA